MKVCVCVCMCVRERERWWEEMSLIYGTDQKRERDEEKKKKNKSFHDKWLKVIKSWQPFKKVTRIDKFRITYGN